MNAQTVEKKERQIPVQTCEPLASVARELAGVIEPGEVWASDKGCRHATESAARRCVVRWREGPAIFLRMDGEQIAVSPQWPDVMTCEGGRYGGEAVRMVPRSWSPRLQAARNISTARVSSTRPPRDLARDIVRRLVLPLSKAWPEAMKEHAEATAYQEACKVAAETAQELERSARDVLSTHSRIYGSIKPNGDRLNIDLSSVTPAQARRLVAFIRDELREVKA